MLNTVKKNNDNKQEEQINSIYRTFAFSSDLISHFKRKINIIDINNQYKTLNTIIKDMKTEFLTYILSVDFNNKNQLSKEFEKEDLYILLNMIKKNDKNLNKTYIIDNFYNSHYCIHGYTIENVIENRNKDEVFYICNHEH